MPRIFLTGTMILALFALFAAPALAQPEDTGMETPPVTDDEAMPVDDSMPADDTTPADDDAMADDTMTGNEMADEVAAATDEATEEAAPWWDAFKFSGDLRVRQQVNYKDGEGSSLSGEERYRHRMRYRLRLRLKYTPEGQPYFAYVHLGTGEEYTSQNVTYDTGYGAAYVREAFVQHNNLFDLFDLAFGLFNVKNSDAGFARTILTFDSDISLGGLHWMFHLADNMVLHGIQSVVSENSSAPDLWIFAAQLQAKKLLDGMIKEAAFGIWSGSHWNTVTGFDSFIVFELLLKMNYDMFQFILHGIYNAGINSANDAPDSLGDNNMGGLIGAVVALGALEIQLFHYYLGGRAWFPGFADSDSGMESISTSITAVQGFELNWFYEMWKGFEIGMEMNIFWEVGDGQPGVSDQDIQGTFTFDLIWTFKHGTPERPE